MKTLTHSNSVQISASLTETKKINSYVFKPIKAGFLGFATIMMLIFFINLISFVVGSTENFGLDIIDLLLAGVGFILQLSSTLLKSFIR